MRQRLFKVIRFYGLIICLTAAAGQESDWEKHLAAARNFRELGQYRESEKEHLLAAQEASRNVL